MKILFKFDVIRYLVRKGFGGIARNKGAAGNSVATMVICVLLFGTVSAIYMNLHAASVGMAANVTISAFVSEDITDERLVEIGDIIRSHELTSSAVYITGDQTWEEYKREYFDGKEELAESFRDDNPLAGSGHYDIHIKDISRQGEYIDFLGTMGELRQINQSQQVAAVFTDMNKLIIVFFASVIFLLMVISVFLVQNAVSTSISARSMEISVMRSIGATEMFIQFPFVVEGLIMGIMGSSIPLVVFFFMYRRIIAYVTVRFASLENLLSFVPERDVFRMLVPTALCMGIGMGLLGSMTTVHGKISKMR